MTAERGIEEGGKMEEEGGWRKRQRINLGQLVRLKAVTQSYRRRTKSS